MENERLLCKSKLMAQEEIELRYYLLFNWWDVHEIIQAEGIDCISICWAKFSQCCDRNLFEMHKTDMKEVSPVQQIDCFLALLLLLRLWNAMTYLQFGRSCTMQLFLHCPGPGSGMWGLALANCAWLSRICYSAVYLSLPSYKELVRKAPSAVHSGLDSADGLWISYFCALLLPTVGLYYWVVLDSVMGVHIRVLVDAQPLLIASIKWLCSSHCLFWKASIATPAPG